MRNVIEKSKPKDPFYWFDKTGRHATALLPDEELRLMYPIPGLLDIVPNTYYLTSYGRVFTTNRNGGYELYEVKTSTSPDGYKVIDLMGIDNIRYHLRINRLVAFFYKPFNFQNQASYLFLEVDHINADKFNNHWSNLRWVTHDENIEAMNFRLNCIKENRMDLWEEYVRRNTDFSAYRDMNSYMFGMDESSQYLINEIYQDTAIFNDINKGKETKLQLSIKYKCSLEKINRIEKLELPFNEFLYIQAKSMKPKRAKVPDEIVLLIYYQCKDNVPIRIIEKNTGYTDAVITDIKFCRGAYEYIRYKYGLEPLPGTFDLDNDLIVQIYYKLKGGARTIDLVAEYGFSDEFITDIKFCRKRFKYLTTEYGLEPLPRTGRK